MVIKNINDVTYEEVVDILKNSGLIIYPTETCYGVGCDPRDQKAVEKLLTYKAKREGKAISIAVTSKEMAKEFVDLNQTAENFYDRFLPGPFTVISKSKGKVSKNIEAENSTLAIRIPEYPWLLELLKEYNGPITSTSANQSYQKQPYKPADILENASESALDLIDLIIDAGELPHRPSSTVVDTTTSDMQVLRKGAFIPENAKISERATSSELETIEFGTNMYEKFKKNLEFRPIIFALQGDLGAGKTHFTKGIAKSMNIEENIQSPTFILSREYESPNKNFLHHIDTWRLENAEDIKSLQIESMLMKNPKSEFNNVIVIEWADKVIDYLRSLDMNLKIIWIEIEHNPNDEKSRIIRWSE